MLLYSFELSLLVETIQLVTKVGSFDVDDLLLNTIGGVCGYLVYGSLQKIRRKWNVNKKTQKRGVINLQKKAIQTRHFCIDTCHHLNRMLVCGGRRVV